MFNIEYKPNILQADAADSITRGFEKVFDSNNYRRLMCMFHMRKAVEKNLSNFSKDKKQQNDFMYDLDRLQLSQSDEVFDRAAEMFVAKWKPVNESFINDYFVKEWLIRHRYWYEGAADRTPSTNNAVEATNRGIKDDHTLRERIDIGRFRTVIFDMIEKWSLAYVNGLKEVHKKPNIDLKLWTSAYAWAKLNVPMKVTECDSEVAYKIPADPAKPDMIDRNLDWNTFDEFKKNNFACHHVKFARPYTEQNWLEGKCSCKDYFKNFICEHIVGVSLRMKYVQAPDEAKNIPLGQKRKRGRIALAKASLVLQ